MHGIETRERSLPGAVDRAVAFVGDHDVEVAGGEFVDAADHRLEQGHRDLLLLARGAGPQPIARVCGKQILDCFERLPRELVAVHQHEHAFHPSGLEEAFQVEADEVGLARSGRQLDQESTLAELQCMVEGAHGLVLVRAHGARLTLADVVLRDFDGCQRLAAGAHLDHAFQVAAREEAGDGAGVVVLVVPEVRELAVGQEDERCTERFRVGERLLLGDIGVDGVSLGLDHGQGTASAVVEDVVGSAARGGRRGKIENGDEFADHVQIAFGLGREDEIAKRRIGIQRLEPDLAMAPVAVRGGTLRALVLLDRELAPERGIGDAALPHEHELALAAATAVGSEQAMGAVGDGGLHRSSADARDEMIARETNGCGHRRPPDLVAGRTHHPVGSEGTGGGFQFVHGCMGLERTRAGPIDDRGGRGGLRRMDLRSDHRLVERVPSGLSQPVVDCDTCVRFGMTSGHPVCLWRDGVVRASVLPSSRQRAARQIARRTWAAKYGLASWAHSVVDSD